MLFDISSLRFEDAHLKAKLDVQAVDYGQIAEVISVLLKKKAVQGVLVERHLGFAIKGLEE